MRLLAGFIALLSLVAAGLAAMELGYGRDPYMAGKVPKKHPELSFSRYAIGDTLGKPSRWSILFWSVPKPISKAACQKLIYESWDDDYDCPYTDVSGLQYLVYEDRITGVILEPKDGRWTYVLPFGLTYDRPLPFDLKYKNGLESMRKHFQTAQVKVEDGPFERHMGYGLFWEVDPTKNLLDSDYAQVVLGKAGEVSLIKVGYWDIN